MILLSTIWSPYVYLIAFLYTGKPQILATENCKKFTKDGAMSAEIMNADVNVLNEADMNVVCLPPTPLKDKELIDNGGRKGS